MTAKDYLSLTFPFCFVHVSHVLFISANIFSLKSLRVACHLMFIMNLLCAKLYQAI